MGRRRGELLGRKGCLDEGEIEGGAELGAPAGAGEDTKPQKVN